MLEWNFLTTAIPALMPNQQLTQMENNTAMENNTVINAH